MDLVRVDGIDLLRFNKNVKLKPGGARILVQPIKEDEFFGSGKLIVRPETARNKPLIGKIVAVGDGHLWDTAYKGEWPPYNVGDTVVYGRYAGYELAMEDVEQELWPRVMTIDEVLGVVESAG